MEDHKCQHHGRLEAEIDFIRDRLEKLEKETDELCEKCLVRKLVFGVIAIVGATLVTAVLALILRGGIK